MASSLSLSKKESTVIGVAFFFVVFLLILQMLLMEIGLHDGICIYLLPSVQVPFCHCQQVFFFGPAEFRTSLAFPLDESLLLLLPFFVFHSGIVDFLRMTVQAFVSFVASTFVEEVVTENLLLVSR